MQTRLASWLRIALPLALVAVAACGGATHLAGDGGAAGTGGDASVQLAPGCPATFTALAQDSPCPVSLFTTCDYDEGRCGCDSCVVPGPAGAHRLVWACLQWQPAGPGCPTRQPVFGTACEMAGQICTYGLECGTTVGRSVRCESGHWVSNPNPGGGCGIRMCPAEHPPDECQTSADCHTGTCFLKLDGSKACVQPAPSSALDECRTVEDCASHIVEGASHYDCVPSGALGLLSATCVSGECRTNADCAQHEGGHCEYGPAATAAPGGPRNVFYCAYPSDP